jgi:hypothetical protein
MRKGLFICMMLLGSAAVVYGQGPWDIAKTSIEGKHVAIEYGRPRLNGRELADLMKMLPPDRIWRAGAGAVTILTTETDLTIGGKKVPAGNYSLYMHCPEKGDYSLIINRVISEPAEAPLPKPNSDRSNRPYPHFMDYASSIAGNEVARVPLKQGEAQRMEGLLYEFDSSGKGALLVIRWGKQAWTVEFLPAK